MQLPRMCVRRCTAVGVNAFGGGISGNGQSKVCAVHVQTHTGREPGAGAKVGDCGGAALGQPRVARGCLRRRY